MPELSPQSKAKLNNKEWLFTQHWVYDKTLAKIGEELGCSGTMVGYCMKKHGIDVMTTRQRGLIKKNKEKYSVR